MDSLFGLKGKDFVVVVAETTVNHSIFKLKTRHEKTISFNDRCVASFSGDHADRCNFGAYVRQNIAFSRFKNGRELTIDEIANFTRTNLAEALRKQPYQVNTLIGGVDKKGPQLYWLDYLGTMTEVNYGAHGHAAYFVSSILSNSLTPDIDQKGALEIIKTAIRELHTRFIVAQNNFSVKVIDKNGISVINLE